MTARKVWTEAKIRELGVRIDGVTAVEIVTGGSLLGAAATSARARRLQEQIARLVEKTK